MLHKRHPRLASATVALLLGFTLADLTGDLLGAPVCAADTDRANDTPATAAQAMMSMQNAEDDAEAPHIDDCFCCSRCVESSPWFSFDAAPGSVDLMSLDPLRRVSSSPDRLYRPPRTS
ncbi:MAG TPA: hypothetical protein VEK15_19170 [Vicinamibacteria bacterium]|nr:hypothetical protein [Vicinamibacteria bacterium]